MTNETKRIPLLIALEYMSKVNNLLNNLIREDKFPAILFAKYDNTFNDLLKMAQIMNFKYRDAMSDELKAEAQEFADNLDRWQAEYHVALKTKSRSSLGLTELNDDLPFKKSIDMSAEDLIKSPKDLEHLEDKVKDVLGRDLFDEVLGRIQSKSREHALSKMMEDMIDKGDLDDEVAN